jgi:hypothetical protein
MLLVSTVRVCAADSLFAANSRSKKHPSFKTAKEQAPEVQSLVGRFYQV